jgi:regulator of RNase E activity RraA
VVGPGDLVAGDADGVVAVPPGELPGLHRACTAHLAREAEIRDRNATGMLDAERFDRVLRAKGLPV